MRLIALDDPRASRPDLVGAKAAMLARARRAGLPVLPGYVVSLMDGRAALEAGCGALRDRGVSAARGAVLRLTVDADLVAQAGAAVVELGGRVIIRSSSMLESDPRWSGAFSSITEIEPDSVEVGLRSCWASAFAPDPVQRAQECGVEPEDLGLGLLIQEELRPSAGGCARIAGAAVEVTAVAGHPGALLAGLVEGDPVAELIGADALAGVMDLTWAVAAIGADAIEWALDGDRLVLLQATEPARRTDVPGTVPPPSFGFDGLRAGGVSCVPGDAAGPLVFVRPHEPVASGCILVAERPVAALAPLLFGARGMVCRTGPQHSHLASVARAIGVPMLVGVALEPVVGALASLNARPGWLGAIDGRRAELVLVPRAAGDAVDRHGAVETFIS
jgi:phosphoenolpyruvate synthase/pyruvate phosphate dikinase